MRTTITCSTCDEEIGTIDKHEITDADRALYLQMVSCSKGHSVATLEEINEDSETIQAET